MSVKEFKDVGVIVQMPHIHFRLVFLWFFMISDRCFFYIVSALKMY